ncbi:MAG: AAA family ATPase, partial [Fusobacteriaceae bacterium]|nr:AAA family ATPase [Fusobacteriaceae bacterium]
DEVDKEKFISSIKGELNYVKLKFSLKLLSELLYKTYNKKVIILIDEYDTPIISAYANKYYDKIIDFFKNFYSSALKDNEYLQFGIMTGIIRVAKEGIFSGLNNLDVYTILDEKFSDFFGLKEDDIDNALKEYKLLDSIDDVKKWYNGYKFGNYDIYNPWSIIKYLNTKKLGAYWVNTSDNYLINEVLDLSDEDIFSELMNLVNNSVTEQYIDESMTFDNLSIQDSLWTLLLSGGYLTIKEKIETGIYLLKIPNKEIYSFFKDILIEKFDKKYT